jgi:hypothetical protein
MCCSGLCLAPGRQGPLDTPGGVGASGETAPQKAATQAPQHLSIPAHLLFSSSSLKTPRLRFFSALRASRAAFSRSAAQSSNSSSRSRAESTACGFGGERARISGGKREETGPLNPQTAPRARAQSPEPVDLGGQERETNGGYGRFEVPQTAPRARAQVPQPVSLTTGISTNPTCQCGSSSSWSRALLSVGACPLSNMM